MPETPTAPTGRGIVVGVDGSDGSAIALAWAAEQTDRFGPIQPVATWHSPWWTLSTPADVDLANATAAQAEAIVSKVPDELRRPTIVTESSAGPTLVAHGADADLIVVGTRGRGAVSDTFLGSVSCHVVGHATVPVAVVPATASPDGEHRRITVGIDGSESAMRALEWALAVARDDETVEVVHAWSYVLAAFPEAPAVPVEQFESAAERVMEKTLAAVPAHSCRLEHRIVEGDPRTALRDAAASTDLLVVGPRGRTGLAHAILGSVTTSLVHQPIVPTVVVPA